MVSTVGVALHYAVVKSNLPVTGYFLYGIWQYTVHTAPEAQSLGDNTIKKVEKAVHSTPSSISYHSANVRVPAQSRQQSNALQQNISTVVITGLVSTDSRQEHYEIVDTDIAKVGMPKCVFLLRTYLYT